MQRPFIQIKFKYMTHLLIGNTQTCTTHHITFPLPEATNKVQSNA